MLEFLKHVIKTIASAIGKFLPLICVFLVAFCFIQTYSLGKRLDVLENRVDTFDMSISKQFQEIQNTLLSINSHLELLDKYASADWEHFYGINNTINIDSKTKRK